MNSEELQHSYEKNREIFHTYINDIKLKMDVSIYSVINTTLIVNPYITAFPKKFFQKKYLFDNKVALFIKSSFKFYLLNMYAFFSFIIGYIIYKLVYKKKNIHHSDAFYFDIFFPVDNINRDKKFNENYFSTVYPSLEGNTIDYVFLPRILGSMKNPFKLISFFKIINEDKRNFLFEYELLTLFDFLELFMMLLLYPFKTLKLLKREITEVDILFNNELIKDIGNQAFDAFSRYIYGKNIAKEKGIKTIYSWSEFQVVERAFNYAIRTNNRDIRLIGCQFYLNYEIYFNAYIYDVDEIHQTAFHTVLVNGTNYIKKREFITYKSGVSLRYIDIFSYEGVTSEKNIVLLGSYIKKETIYMLQCMQDIENVLFKTHPALSVNTLQDIITNNFLIVNDSIYTLFRDAKVVVSTASGTCVEAVACGISVIVIASKDNLTANPLVKYGQGKIWDIAYSKDELENKIKLLSTYRTENMSEIMKISHWYKDNFFVEPSVENIEKVFELKK